MALGLSMFAASLSWQVPIANGSTAPLDAQASEMVRLINGARVASGHRSLNVDTVLASVARNGAIPCPDDASKTIAGRSQDFAAWSAMSHLLRLCDVSGYALSTTEFVSVLQSHWGYGSVGEIDVVNGGYGNGAYLYTYGSFVTWTYSTTGHAIQGWASSSSHWAIVMGGYDRVGCGGWANGSSYYYDCIFASGGPNGVVGPPTASPFNLPLPTTAPAPTAPPPPPAPVSTPFHAPPVAGGGGGSGSGANPATASASTPGPSPTPVSATPTPWPTGGRPIAVARPTSPAAGALALQTSSGQLGGSNGGSSLATLMALVVALGAAAAATVLATLAKLPSIRRRRGTSG